jgi:hypothetical protein
MHVITTLGPGVMQYAGEATSILKAKSNPAELIIGYPFAILTLEFPMNVGSVVLGFEHLNVLYAVPLLIFVGVAAHVTENPKIAPEG